MTKALLVKQGVSDLALEQGRSQWLRKQRQGQTHFLQRQSYSDHFVHSFGLCRLSLMVCRSCSQRCIGLATWRFF